MPRRKITDRNIRKIMKGGNGSYMTTLPIEMIKKLGWKERQKIVFNLRGKTITIKDWGRKIAKIKK